MLIFYAGAYFFGVLIPVYQLAEMSLRYNICVNSLTTHTVINYMRSHHQVIRLLYWKQLFGKRDLTKKTLTQEPFTPLMRDCRYYARSRLADMVIPFSVVMILTPVMLFGEFSFIQKLSNILWILFCIATIVVASRFGRDIQ